MFKPADLGPWRTLWVAHCEGRAFEPDDVTRIRSRLGFLAERGLCESRAQFSVMPQRTGKHERTLDFDLALGGLQGTFVGDLSIQIAWNDRQHRLLRSTIMLRGRGTEGTSLAVHLDPSPRGTGACGHALVHCHVWPSPPGGPEIRVPFPFASPVSALDWALSQALPDWEPAPWHLLLADAD